MWTHLSFTGMLWLRMVSWLWLCRSGSKNHNYEDRLKKGLNNELCVCWGDIISSYEMWDGEWKLSAVWIILYEVCLVFINTNLTDEWAVSEQTIGFCPVSAQTDHLSGFLYLVEASANDVYAYLCWVVLTFFASGAGVLLFLLNCFAYVALK